MKAARNRKEDKIITQIFKLQVAHHEKAGVVNVEFPWRQAVDFREQDKGLIIVDDVDGLELCVHQFVCHIKRLYRRHRESVMLRKVNFLDIYTQTHKIRARESYNVLLYMTNTMKITYTSVYTIG